MAFAAYSRALLCSHAYEGYLRSAISHPSKISPGPIPSSARAVHPWVLPYSHACERYSRLTIPHPPKISPGSLSRTMVGLFEGKRSQTRTPSSTIGNDQPLKANSDTTSPAPQPRDEPAPSSSYGVKVLYEPPNPEFCVYFLHGLGGDRETSWTATPSSSYGVKVLYEPPNPKFCINFLHGLGGDRLTSWTARGQSEPWIATLLPTEFPTARIATCGYNADILQKLAAGPKRFRDLATDILNDIAADRALHNISSLPIIFVGHSLGGLVWKEVMLQSQNCPRFRSIFDCVKGIVFMGTPHKGSWMANWVRIPAWLLGLIQPINKPLLDILRQNDPLGEYIGHNFLEMIQKRESGNDIKLICFYEESALFIWMVVPRESAVIDRYPSFGSHAHHINMIKFSSADDEGFRKFCETVAKLVSEIR